MENISQKLDNYISDHIEPEGEVLEKLNRETHMKVLYSRMCSGHIQGNILTLLSKLVSPKYILEIGTFTGYSAICLAKGLQKDGELHTVEINDELEELSYNYFQKSGLGDHIFQHIGDAEKIVPTLDKTFDLVFLDADKRRYSEHYDLIFSKVKVGGLILADNTLWDGKVVEPLEKNDAQTRGILAFNKKVKEDTRVETYMFPIRDGLTALRKISD